MINKLRSHTLAYRIFSIDWAFIRRGYISQCTLFNVLTVATKTFLACNTKRNFKYDLFVQIIIYAFLLSNSVIIRCTSTVLHLLIMYTFNLSPVTPIICIRLPVEVLGKRNIDPSTYLHICLHLLFIMYYPPKTQTKANKNIVD